MRRGSTGGLLRAPAGGLGRGQACCCNGCCGRFTKLYVPVQIMYAYYPGCTPEITTAVRSIPLILSGHYGVASNHNVAWNLPGGGVTDVCDLAVDFWCFLESGVHKGRIRIEKSGSGSPNLLPTGTIYDQTVDCSEAGLYFPCAGPLPSPYFPYYRFFVNLSSDTAVSPQDHDCPE